MPPFVIEWPRARKRAIGGFASLRSPSARIPGPSWAASWVGEQFADLLLRPRAAEPAIDVTGRERHRSSLDNDHGHFRPVAIDRRFMDSPGPAKLAEGFELEGLIGQLVADRYRVDALIGSGAMGAVLRCRHVGLDHDVALKVLHPTLCHDPDVMRRFEQEAKSASRLDHPNCVRVLDFGGWRAAGLPPSKYLCMELVWGVELSRLLEQPLGVAFALDVVGQMLDGLAHAHSRGLVHRDVKPQNVIVVGGAGGNVVKLVDFGIAKVLVGEASRSRMTREGRICGTPNYMSPEQVVGGPIDGRADLYAIGVLLHRMLAGRLPFEADDPRRVMEMHVTAQPARLPDHVPPALRKWIATLLAKDCEQRPASASIARAQLDAILAETVRGPTRSTATPTTEAATNGRARRTWPESIDAPAASGASDRSRRNGAAVRGAYELPSPTEPVIAELRPRARESDPPRRRWLAPSALGSAMLAAMLVVVLLPEPRPDEPPPWRRAPEVTAAAVGEGGEPTTVRDDAGSLARARELAGSTLTHARALDAYDEALTRDPSLLDDPQVFAEIAALTRDPHLRVAALDLVLEHFGSRGNALLVELLNTRLMPLGYHDRQRALAVVAHDPSLAALVDRRHLDALDLRDAATTDTPCLVFAAALARIDGAGDPLDVPLLQGVRVPSAPPGSDPETRSLCERLPGLVEATRARLARAAGTD